MCVKCIAQFVEAQMTEKMQTSASLEYFKGRSSENPDSLTQVMGAALCAGLEMGNKAPGPLFVEGVNYAIHQFIDKFETLRDHLHQMPGHEAGLNLTPAGDDIIAQIRAMIPRAETDPAKLREMAVASDGLFGIDASQWIALLEECKVSGVPLETIMAVINQGARNAIGQIIGTMKSELGKLGIEIPGEKSPLVSLSGQPFRTSKNGNS